MAKSQTTPESDPSETQKAWDTWVWFLKISKAGGIVIACALFVLLGIYLAGQ